MHAHTVLSLLCCLLLPSSLLAAPLPDAVERARMLADKISGDIPAVRAAVANTEGLTLDLSQQAGGLLMMAASLGIPPAPVLKPLSVSFTPDMCVSRMVAGGRMYQGLLGVLSERINGLDDLWTDLRDLLTQIARVREAAGLSEVEMDQDPSADLASRLHGDYELQVAVHLTLWQLRSFCHDMIRSLRTLSTYSPPPFVRR